MKIQKYILPLALAISAHTAMADKIGWFYNPQAIIGPFKSPDALCASLGSKVANLTWVGSISWGAASAGRCDNDGGTGFFKLGDECDQGEEFDFKSQSCIPREDKDPSNCPSGTLDPKGQCDPEANLDDCSNETAGNPIIIASGQKVETVTDITLTNSQLAFTRNYWSSRLKKDDLGIGWQHNWQMRLELLKDKDRVKLYRGNGRGIIYSFVNGHWESYTPERDVLVKLDNNQGWKLYTTSNEVETYNNLGKLVSYAKAGYLTINFTYNAQGLLTQLTEAKTGNKLVITYNTIGFISKVVGNATATISYTYDTKNRLTKVTQNGKSKTYHYENSQYPNLLTGFTNEAGIRYATWTYNNKGQAISSEHANGTDKYLFEYLDKNKTRVTNPLGKSAIYHFQDIRLSKKITKIEGEAINSCMATNVSYQYNGNGQLLSKINANNSATYYKYNDRGLQISQNEPFIKEVKTKWHDFFSLPIEISAVGRKQTFKYDDQGRLLEFTFGFVDKSAAKQEQDVALLNFKDFTDTAGNIWQKVGNPIITEDSEAIDGSSLYLDGNSYLTTDNSAGYFDFGRDDFTIEMWVKPETVGTLFDAMYRYGDAASYTIYVLDNGYPFWQSYQYGETNLGYFNGVTNLLDGKWHHLAMSRERGLLRMFIDGRLANFRTITHNYLLTEGISVSIGARANESATDDFKTKGYIDQLRVTKKALYTENFTPSRTAYVLNK